MRVSILVVYLTMLGPVAGTGRNWQPAGIPNPVAATAEPQRSEPGTESRQDCPTAEDPDALYAQRENLECARRAADIWETATRRNPKDFEAAWKLSRARCCLGDRVPAAQRKSQYTLGVEAARLAIAAQPNRPEGHFWLATSLGGLGELSMWSGFKYRNTIRDEYEIVVRLDQGWDEGSGLIGLGRWHSEVPSFLGGSKAKSEEYLRRALSYDPYGTIVHYFLAETLLGLGRRAEARAELTKAIEAPLDPDYLPEDREWKRKARELLQTIAAR